MEPLVAVVDVDLTRLGSMIIEVIFPLTVMVLEAVLFEASERRSAVVKTTTSRFTRVREA